MRIFATTVLCLILLSAAALAQDSGVEGATGQGLITLEQLAKDLIPQRIEFAGVYVHFVLPKGWELVMQGTDPQTGELQEGINTLVALSRRPVHSPDEPTDLIFELDIFRLGLTEDLPADTKAEDREPGVQLWNFLNEQLSINLKGGLKCRTKANEIMGHAYGKTSKERPPTYFVPLIYDTPEGAGLYTFTTFTGDKVWMLKFLVAEGQIENYGALIALILDNSFGLTDAQVKEMEKP